MYKPSQIIQLKQYNSVTLAVAYTDEAGQSLPLTGIVITAQLRDSSQQLLGEMTVTRVDSDKGLFALTLPTYFVPSKAVFVDIRFLENGTVRNSDIVQLVFSEVVTHG